MESHKLTEGRKLENEFLLKQMLWENQQNNKLYKQSVEEYEKRQRKLEEMRLKNQRSDYIAPQLLTDKNMSIKVAGEPLFRTDNRGNTLINKMRYIEENFDDIETLVIDFLKVLIQLNSWF